MLKIGHQGTHEIVVTEELLAKRIGSGRVGVFATVMMIAGMEACAVESVQPFLDEGYTTVGTRVNVTHEAATPLGMRVRFTSELIEISENGRQLRFQVAAYDEAGLIGQGMHERVIVNTQKFERKTFEKPSRRNQQVTR